MRAPTLGLDMEKPLFMIPAMTWQLEKNPEGAYPSIS